MNIDRLRTFYEVAKHKGFSRARTALRVGQPAITKSVQLLEAELGVILFERGKREVHLTAAGEIVFRHCLTIFDAVREIERSAKTATTVLAGDLSIGTSDHLAAFLLPPAIEALGRAHPQIIPRVMTASSYLLVQEIMSGRIELAFLFKVPGGTRMDRLTLARFPCQIVVRADLANDPRVLRSFIGSRELDNLSNKSFPTVARLKKQRPDTAIRLSCNSLLAHKAMVLAGCGISILPRFLVDAEIRAQSLAVVLPRYRFAAELELVTAPGRRLSREAHALLALVRKQLEQI